MKIYDVEGFPNPARIRMALAEKGALDKVQFIPVNVMASEHRSPEYRVKNPDACVPLLELADGNFISQCTAITEYIDGTFPGESLCGNTPFERAVIHMMNRRMEAGLLDAVGDYFHNATPGLGPELEAEQNPRWGLIRKRKAIETMEYLDEVLKKSDYVAGDRFSMADITAYAGLAFADFAQIEIPDRLKKLAAWRRMIASRASVAS